MLIIKRIGMILLLTISLSMNMNARAAACQQDFPNYFVQQNGNLALYTGTSGHWWYACNISVPINSVTTDSCKAALATLLIAKTQKKLVTFSWSGTCEELAPATATSSITGRGFGWMGIYWGYN